MQLRRPWVLSRFPVSLFSFSGAGRRLCVKFLQFRGGLHPARGRLTKSQRPEVTLGTHQQTKQEVHPHLS